MGRLGCLCILSLLGCPLTPTKSVEQTNVEPPSQTKVGASHAEPERPRTKDRGSSYDIAHRFAYRGQELVVKLSIDKQKLERAIASYGIPRGQEQFPDPLSDDLLKQRQVSAKLQAIDILRRGEQVFIRPDFRLLSLRAEAELSEVHRTLLAMDVAQKLDQRDLAEFFLAFVQSFQIADPPRYRRHPDGHEVLVAGVRPGLETVYLGQGDCDTLSVVLGALLRRSKVDVLYLLGSLDGVPHMFLGALLAPRSGDLIIPVDRQNYIVFETTARYAGGPMPEAVRAQLRNKAFEVVDLDPVSPVIR